jgi:hypothetical protein
VQTGRSMKQKSQEENLEINKKKTIKAAVIATKDK